MGEVWRNYGVSMGLDVLAPKKEVPTSAFGHSSSLPAAGREEVKAVKQSRKQDYKFEILDCVLIAQAPLGLFPCSFVLIQKNPKIKAVDDFANCISFGGKSQNSPVPSSGTGSNSDLFLRLTLFHFNRSFIKGHQFFVPRFMCTACSPPLTPSRSFGRGMPTRLVFTFLCLRSEIGRSSEATSNS